MTNERVKIWPRYLLFKVPKFHPGKHGCHDNASKPKTSVILSVTNRVSSVWLTLTSHAVPVCVTLRPYAQLTWSHMVPAGPLVAVMDSGYSLFKKASYGPKEQA